MKILKGLVLALLCCGFVAACGSGGDSPSEQSTADLSSREQAELVAAAITAKEGGLGMNFEIIAQPTSQDEQALVQGGLNVSSQMTFYDGQGTLQEQFDPAATDRIQYNGRIKGDLTVNACFFQEMSLDNQSNFTVDDILSDTAMINGTHHLHASYAHNSTISSTAVNFNLDCDLNVTGVTVKMNTIDVIPDTGAVNGSIVGSYVRHGAHSDINHSINFQFDVTYLGDNTAEIDLSGDAAFSVNLDTGIVVEININ